MKSTLLVLRTARSDDTYRNDIRHLGEVRHPREKREKRENCLFARAHELFILVDNVLPVWSKLYETNFNHAGTRSPTHTRRSVDEKPSLRKWGRLYLLLPPRSHLAKTEPNQVTYHSKSNYDKLESRNACSHAHMKPILAEIALQHGTRYIRRAAHAVHLSIARPPGHPPSHASHGGTHAVCTGWRLRSGRRGSARAWRWTRSFLGVGTHRCCCRRLR